MAFENLYTLLVFYLKNISIVNFLISLVLGFCGQALISPWFLPQLPKQSSHTLRLVMTSNAPPSRYYRSCWHLVSPGFSSDLKSLFYSAHELYGHLGFHSPKDFSSPQNPGSNFRLLTNILHCCQRWGIFHSPCDWTIFQFS